MMLLDDAKLGDLVLESLRRQLAMRIPMDPVNTAALLCDAVRFDEMVREVASAVTLTIRLAGEKP